MIKKLSKKSMEVSPPSLVVVIVLVLIVLLVLLFAFGNSSKNFLSFITDLWTQGKGEKCESPLLHRYCGNCPNGFSAKQTIPPPSNGWSDCNVNCIECISTKI